MMDASVRYKIENEEQLVGSQIDNENDLQWCVCYHMMNSSVQNRAAGIEISCFVVSCMH
jgi:hypothetical protein